MRSAPRQTWTNRFYMSVACGCIPVTVMRGTDMPWQRQGLNYSEFSVNLEVRRLCDDSAMASVPALSVLTRHIFP